MVAAIKSARNRKNQPSTHVYTYTCITTSNSLDEGITSPGAEQATPLDKGWGGSRANWFLGRETRSLETGWSFRDIGELLRTIRMKRILWNRMGPRDSPSPFFFSSSTLRVLFSLIGKYKWRNTAEDLGIEPSGTRQMFNFYDDKGGVINRKINRIE